MQVIIASCYAVIVITIWRKGQTMQPPRVTQSLLPRGQYQGTKDTLRLTHSMAFLDRCELVFAFFFSIFDNLAFQSKSTLLYNSCLSGHMMTH